jgi:hypothetical protein
VAAHVVASIIEESKTFKKDFTSERMPKEKVINGLGGLLYNFALSIPQDSNSMADFCLSISESEKDLVAFVKKLMCRGKMALF